MLHTLQMMKKARATNMGSGKARYGCHGMVWFVWRVMLCVMLSHYLVCAALVAIFSQLVRKHASKLVCTVLANSNGKWNMEFLVADS